MIENTFLFDDYDFYPNLDSHGNDIMQVNCNIIEMKELADSMNACVGFNTYGWLKHNISSIYKLNYLKNQHYNSDGLYIKKSFDRKTLRITNKVNALKQILNNRPIKIFIGRCANAYSFHIVGIILKCFPKYEIVPSYYDEYDVLINNHCDTHFHITEGRLNIAISGEPWNINCPYDICIDTKFKSVIKNTIHYPFLFASLREHKRSINPADYVNTKEKFCVFLYSQMYPHRNKYFDLLSTYKFVDAPGKSRNNITIEGIRDEEGKKCTLNDISVEIYTSYKFVISIENELLGGYSTEKLMQPIIANSIPIYWGDNDIFKYINKKRIIYIPDFSSDEALLEYIKYIDTNDDAYNEIVNQDVYVDPNFTLESIELELGKTIASYLKFV